MVYQTFVIDSFYHKGMIVGFIIIYIVDSFIPIFVKARPRLEPYKVRAVSQYGFKQSPMLDVFSYNERYFLAPFYDVCYLH